jgi:hypothetical protein
MLVVAETAAMGATDSRRLRLQLAELADHFSDRPEDFASAVMDVLSGMGVVAADAPAFRILSPQGALLSELARTPGSTLRSMSVRLGWSEGYVQKVVSQLASAGLVHRTRLGQRVVYTIVRHELVSHPDSVRIAILFSSVASTEQAGSADSST